MKIYIGKHRYRFTVNRIEDLWYKFRYKVQSRWQVKDDQIDRWDRAFEKVTDKLQDFFNATVNQIQDRRKPKIKVRVDYWDVWSADHTLAVIILPVLHRLKTDKHGSPFVDLEDVPEHLHPTEPAGPENGYTDNTIHERWEWVLNEMIWAFEQIVDDDHDCKFFDHSAARQYETENPNDLMGHINLIKVEREGLRAHHERITRGTTLFGKYYRALWT
jgi:hypothetical protein